MTVRVTGWDQGFRTISFIKLLRQSSLEGYGLSRAKALVDGLLEGRAFSLRFASVTQAREFVAEARKLGAFASEVLGPGTQDGGAE